MGCQSSKQRKNAKACSELPKLQSNGNARYTIAGKSSSEKLCAERNKEEFAERVTLSVNGRLLANPNEDMKNNELELQGSRGLELKSGATAVACLGAVGGTSTVNRSKQIMGHKHQSRKSPVHSKANRSGEGKLRRKYKPKGSKRLQIRSKNKRHRVDPEDDTLYEVPLKMPEFDLVPSQMEDSIV